MIITNKKIDQVVVEWSVVDEEYSYADIYTFTAEEYAALTPEDLLARQTAQYNAWKAYMINPGV